MSAAALAGVFVPAAWAATRAGEGGTGFFGALFLVFGAVFTAVQVIPALALIGMVAAFFVQRTRRKASITVWVKQPA